MVPSNPWGPASDDARDTRVKLAGRLRRWRDSSLGHSIMLRAASQVLVSVSVVAGLSIAILYWIERQADRAELQHKSEVAAARLVQPIRIMEYSLAALSRSAMFTTALLDSGGRSAYAKPYLQNFSFPVSGANGVALCDINGMLLAGTPVLAECHGRSAEFSQVLADGKTRQKLVTMPDGRQLWVILQGVPYAYTGSIEGVTVGLLELDAILRAIPAELGLRTAVLRADQASSGTAREGGWGFWPGPVEALAVPVFDGDGSVTSPPLELVIEAHTGAFWGKFLPLLAGYFLATVFLVAAVLAWTQRSAQALVHPLLALRDRAHSIAASGDLTQPIPKGGADEVGQLASSIDAMVRAIRSAEATRGAAETRFKLMFETSGEAIIFAWPDGRVETANSEATRLFGFDVDELRELGRAGVMDTTDPRLSTALEQRSRTGSFRGELRCRRRDGSVFPVDLVSTIFLDDAGEARSTNMFRDISEQKLAEAELKRFQDIVSSMPDCVVLFDRDYRYLMVNPAFEAFSGMERLTLVGRTLETHVGPDIFDRVSPAFDRCLQGEVVTYQDWFELPAKDRRFVTVTFFPSRDADDRITGVVAIARDITERKQTNDALQDSLATLRLREQALATISQGVLISGADRRITYVSPAFERLTGYDLSEVIGGSCSILHGPGTDPLTSRRVREALDAGVPFHGEILNYRKDGSSFWNDLSITPVFDAAGKLTQFVGVQRDVSERRHSMLSLQASEALIKTVFDSLEEQVVVLDGQGVILAANNAWRRFGADNGAPGEVIEGIGLNYLATCEAAAGSGDVGEAMQAMAGVGDILAGRRGPFSLEYPCHSPTEQRWFRMQAIPLQGPRRGAVVIHESITERIESARRLNTMSKRLVEVQETARRHLAGELHDRTSANLAAIILNLDAAAIALEQREWWMVAERMGDNRALVEDTAVSIREICAELRPPVLDYAGLVPALESYVAQFARRTGLEAVFRHSGREEKPALAPATESALFRIAQEALTNVAKHADAKRVTVELATRPPCLDVCDDGRGFQPLFDPPIPGATGGLGIITMRETTELSGGTFELHSQHGGGTRIVVRLPDAEEAP
jgi:PAS domain S-box-containing protein